MCLAIFNLPSLMVQHASEYVSHSLIYVTDAANHAVRVIDTDRGTVSTLMAKQGMNAASLSMPFGITLHGSELYYQVWNFPTAPLITAVHKA